MPTVVTQPPKSNEQTQAPDRRDAMRAGLAALMGSLTFGAGCASTRSGPDTASRLQLGMGVQDSLPQPAPVDLVKRELGSGVHIRQDGKAEVFLRPLQPVDEKFLFHAAAWSKAVEQRIHQHNSLHPDNALRNVIVTFDGKVHAGETGNVLGQMNNIPQAPSLPR